MPTALDSPTYAIGSWQAGSNGVADGFGSLFGVNPAGTTGIFDGPDVRTNQTPFSGHDGAMRSRSYRLAATLTLAGWAQAPSRTAAAASRRAFRGTFTGGGQWPLTITDVDGVVLTMTVELNGAPKTVPWADGCGFDWQVSLIAADPYQYLPPVVATTGLPTAASGLDWSTGGGLDWTGGATGGLMWGTPGNNGLLQLTNTGDVEAWPVFTISAATDGAFLTNPIIVNSATGQQLAYTDTLVLGDQVVLRTSPYTRAVLKNGVPYRRNLTTAQWFPVPANATISVQFQGTSTSTTPSLSATLASAL